MNRCFAHEEQDYQGRTLFFNHQRMLDVGVVAWTVRRQIFLVQRRLKLRECLAHLANCIVRRDDCDASAELRMSFV
jgi:hypothetical protein